MLKRPSKSTGGYRKRARGSKPAAAAAAAVTKIVRRVALKTHELKQLNTNVLGLGVTSAMQLTLINGLAQGTGGDDRIGRDVYNEFVDLRYQINTNANVPEVVRVLVVYDKTCRGSSFASSDLFATTTATFLPVSNFNADNLGVRFRILYDRTHDNLPPTTTAIATRSYRARVPVKSKSHYYDIAGATIAAIDAGSLFLVYVSYSAASSTISYDTMLNFRDV